MQNRLVLTVTVDREDALRYTPAGLPVVEMWLKHQSRQSAGGFERDVACDIQAVWVGEEAKKHAGKLAGRVMNVTGFLSQRSLRNPRLVLNIEYVEFVKG
ncbi:primosomal replication protein N [Chromobacterium violaceum]|uniref:Replication restart protein PriB n=1 Tax=Chromobacterium violaceum (strain ATCC 12472 / DSM 30191 / JCM 1249 / CCUG 213 / NBRC 12614 / NCIMB 9131 / NCTC 9757 / MK) TaxID=243365 RepID=Q7NRY8_CHRVO|nr:primosomal replication protein N [Chromobacterium violaceum]AAQ61301.1 primosomal replication protein [Chromobacterium violaceum ATCC 12472]ATP29916.1 primosomal replication protein N [Chromobacterium violaceum]ATP33822.1 primosomal replication protein N [Chromobacterium violaceum]KMN47518.1 prepilin peptidase [Chromobacterium violaceum]KMN87377.1 prepilin peptidase [Chromobacterium violaceum]